MPDHPRWTDHTDPPDVSVLFSTVLARRRQHAADARLRGDPEAESFWLGIVGIVEAMERDLKRHPRPAPEVTSFLARASRG